MLKFPKGYFRGEEREGFYVEEMMKCAWAAQMEILQRVGEVCEKHGLVYQAVFGTLLGAVRHKGFVPWDDDIDILMPRKDYTTLLELAGQELPPEYRVLSIDTENEWYEINARIMNNDAIDTSEKWMREYHGCPFAMGIDVYPMDPLPDKEEVRELLTGMLRLIGRLDELVVEREMCLQKGQEHLEYDRTIREGLAALEQYYGVRFVWNNTLRNQLYRLYDRLCVLYGKDSDACRVVYPVYLKYPNFPIKWQKEWLENTQYMDFENIRMPVPTDPHACLRAVYGVNYMVPKQGISRHEYPVYLRQQRILEERGLWEETLQRARKVCEEEE